jgi:hypothetical protein
MPNLKALQRYNVMKSELETNVIAEAQRIAPIQELVASPLVS